jgi:hypothetical protein
MREMNKLNYAMLAAVLINGTAAIAVARPGGLLKVGEPVKGVPYSAEAVTETTKIRADGNRVTAQSSSRIYRDSEGRERREEALNPVTGLSATPDRNPTVYISDPVAGATYVLNVLGHSAIRMPKPFAPPPPLENPAGGFAPTIVFEPTPGPGGVVGPQIIITPGNHIEITGPNGPSGPLPTMSPTRIEHLEPRMIEGFRAEGTRTIETVPIGRADNDQPAVATNMEIVSETWVSPDLKVELMTRHSDPRTGETAYRLTNISRAEPARSLFEIPSDYSISDMPAISGGMITGGVSVGPIVPHQ